MEQKKRLQTLPISHFFKKKKVEDDNENEQMNPSGHSNITEEPEPAASASTPGTSSAAEQTIDPCTNDVGVTTLTPQKFDIGAYASNPPEDDLEKLRAFKEPWMPPKQYQFPVSGTGKKKNKFQMSWFEIYPWLVYSELLKGAFCKTCVLFSRSTAGRGDHQVLGCLVKKPFSDYKHAKERFSLHEKQNYHKEASVLALNFVSIAENKTTDIISKLSEERQRLAITNREKLRSIIATIIFCGRQEIALRGTNDYGPLGEVEPLQNDGNYRALLRFRAKSGDEVLKKHLKDSENSRAMFTSPAIQNEVIELCGNQIQEAVVKRMAGSVFSVLADETQDISRTEQMAICVRYVDFKNNESILREDFLTYVPVEDVTAPSLASTITSTLSKMGLDLTKMVGQGYDGASVMRGHLGGVRTIIAAQYPKAKYVHCAAHSLNLAIAHSSELSVIRNCVGTVKSAINFFRQSGQRDGLFKRMSKNEKHHNLIALCETRWSEKHRSIERFVGLFPVIIETLKVLENSQTTATQVQAYQLVKSLTSSQFIITLLVIQKVFSYTFILCQSLQKVDVDLVRCCAYIKNIQDVLQQLRNDPKQFAAIFNSAKEIADKYDEEITMPRLAGKQTCRENIKAETPEEYYRINLFLPFLDHVLSELNMRFSLHNECIMQLQRLLPSKCKDLKETELTEVINLYLEEETKSVFAAELHLWKNKWEVVGMHDAPTKVLEAIDKCDEDFFPNIRKLLIILATIPVSTATAERMFSTMKRLKSWTRNTMGDNRLKA